LGRTKEGGHNVLFIDGRVWKRGQPAGGLADKARALYGARNEEFIESIKAFAYFPIAVAKGIDDFQNGEISVRFQMVGGTLDRCAGILFNVKPNGDYLTGALQRHGGQRRAVDVQQRRSKVS
jgi:prepilin-type processing-associated H-X9-DG protein